MSTSELLTADRIQEIGSLGLDSPDPAALVAELVGAVDEGGSPNPTTPGTPCWSPRTSWSRPATWPTRSHWPPAPSPSSRTTTRTPERYAAACCCASAGRTRAWPS
ncbi:hypothetical protein NKG94_48000 [Micromonospora sp. M12]